MSDGRVLVVDDEEIVRDVLTRYLEREGFHVDAAADGEAALELAARSLPDIVVLDLMLPKVDGLEVFRRLRDLGDVPVVMSPRRGRRSTVSSVSSSVRTTTCRSRSPPGRWSRGSEPSSVVATAARATEPRS